MIEYESSQSPFIHVQETNVLVEIRIKWIGWSFIGADWRHQNLKKNA